MLKYVIIILAMMLALTGVRAPPPPPASPPPAPAKAYIAALQWPITVCSTENCMAHTDPLPESFKLHGLWPTAPGWDPSLKYCEGGDEFSGNAVKPFRKDLVTYWPSYLMRENAFWEHEWNKHGKCSGMLVPDYFKEAVQLTKLYSKKLLNGLANSGIRPGPIATTTPDAIRYAIETNLRVRPKLTCASTGTTHKIFWLKEIHLCMDQTFGIQDCPEKYWVNKCGDDSASTKIKFPN